MTDERWSQYQKTKTVLSETRNLLESIILSPQGWAKHGISVQFDGVARRYEIVPGLDAHFVTISLSAFHLLRYPGVTAVALKNVIPGLVGIEPRILGRIDIDGL